MANQLVVLDGFQPVTNSRIVSDHFGKEHKNVVRDIRTLVQQMASERQSSKLRSAQMFTETTYQAEDGGRRYPMFTMNRDGFSLLAMGFTGKKALKFKLRFIDAFNKMEASSNSSPLKVRTNAGWRRALTLRSHISLSLPLSKSSSITFASSAILATKIFSTGISLTSSRMLATSSRAAET